MRSTVSIHGRVNQCTDAKLGSMTKESSVYSKTCHYMGMHGARRVPQTHVKLVVHDYVRPDKAQFFALKPDSNRPVSIRLECPLDGLEVCAEAIVAIMSEGYEDSPPFRGSSVELAITVEGKTPEADLLFGMIGDTYRKLLRAALDP